MRRVSPAVLLTVAACLFAPAGVSLAAEPSSADKETARGLVRNGDAAFAEHDLPSALKAYRAAYDVVKVPTTGIEVVKTLDAMGKLVEARDVALEVTRIPVTTGEHPSFAAARERAAAAAADLAERIPSLKIEVTGPADATAIELTVDGERVAAEAARLGRKVNPGKHAIAAHASGSIGAQIEIEVKERQVTPVTLALRASAGGAPLAPVRARDRQPLWGLAYTGFIGGGVLVAAGAVTGGVSFARAHALADACDAHTSGCTASRKSTANALAWVSNITLPLGVVGLGLGVVGLLVRHDVEPSSSSSSSSFGLAPIVGPGFIGLEGKL